MTRINNLNGSRALSGLKEQARSAGLNSPMNNSGIGEGGIEVYDGGVIRITNGGLSVTGSADIIGELIARGIITFSGTLTQSGPSTFNGETTLNGLTHINGDTDVTGKFDVDGPMTTTSTLDVEGVTTIKNDLNIADSGRIKVGNTIINPVSADGGIDFESGGGVAAASGTVLVKGTGNAGLITSDGISIFAGPNSVDVGASDVTIRGPLYATGLTSTSNAANVYFDPASKRLYYKP